MTTENKLDVQSSLDIWYELDKNKKNDINDFNIKKKWVSVDSLIEKLKGIYDGAESCDIGTDVIYDWIKELEKEE